MHFNCLIDSCPSDDDDQTTTNAHMQVFVLMQFDPGLEYKPPSVRRATNVTAQSAGVGGGGSNKDDNSWLLLCSALTDGPYSYIWTTEIISICNVMQFIQTVYQKIIGKIYFILRKLRMRKPSSTAAPLHSETTDTTTDTTIYHF